MCPVSAEAGLGEGMSTPEPITLRSGAAAAVRPAHAPRETLPLTRRDVVPPAHHELLDLAPVVRRPGDAVSVVASGLGPGPLSGHYHILLFRGADKSSLSDPAVLTQE